MGEKNEKKWGWISSIVSLLVLVLPGIAGAADASAINSGDTLL